MTDESIPADVLEQARARRQARLARDWPEADRLKAAIEAAGWRVVDRGVDFSLRPAEPPDAIVDGVVRHGGSRSVPSRLDEPATGLASVVIVADRGAEPFARTLAALRRAAPTGTQLVVVDVPAPDGIGHADVHPEVEVVPMAGRVGPAVALDAGMRRVTGGAVVVLEAGLEPDGDIVSPLVEALADPGVAVAGAWGSVTADVRRFTPASSGAVDVLDHGCLAFRRADYVARGPFDERFVGADWFAIWLTLVLRDEGPDRPARTALVVPGLPIAPPEAPAVDADRPDDEAVARARKRDFYRVVDRFGRRHDLLGGGRPS